MSTMKIKRSSRQVLVCKSPDGFQHLADPKVLAVVWSGAWSNATRRFIDGVVSRPENNIPESDEVKFPELPETSELKNNPAMNDDLHRFTGLFETLGIDLLGRKTIRNLSRMEPAIASDYTNGAAPWHADGGGLLMLGVPVGPTPQCITKPVTGSFDEWSCFTPDDPRPMERMARSIPDNALMVFKGAHYPNAEKRHNHGLIHRRPNAIISAAPVKGRFVFHLKM